MKMAILRVRKTHRKLTPGRTLAFVLKKEKVLVQAQLKGIYMAEGDRWVRVPLTRIVSATDSYRLGPSTTKPSKHLSRLVVSVASQLKRR